MKGLDAILVLNQPRLVVMEFCVRAQYRVTNRTTLGSGEPGDLLVQFSYPQRVMTCLDIVELKRGECAAVFAHDADPLYLIEAAD